MDSADDPGWRSALDRSWSLFVPGLLQIRMKQAAERGDGALVILRSLWLAFVVALGLIGVVVLILRLGAGYGSDPENPPPLTTATGLAIVSASALLSLGVGAWLRRRPLDGSSLPALAGSFRQAFFLQVAVAEAAALVAFVGFILSGTAWLYLLGLAAAWGQLAAMAPTARHLDNAQRELRRRGSRLQLLQALALPPPPPTDRRRRR